MIFEYRRDITLKIGDQLNVLMRELQLLTFANQNYDH